MRIYGPALFVVLLGSGLLLAKESELKDALQDDLVHDSWIYEDIEKGYAQAKKTGKPLLVSFRCVP